MWSQTIEAFGRRWYLLLAGLLLTAGIGLYTLQAVPPTYQVSGTLLLLPSEMQTDQGQNPFLELDGLEAPAEFVVSRLNGGESRSRVLEEAAPTADYAVQLDTSSRGPLILAVAYDATAEGAQQVLEEVLIAVPDALYSLQADLDVPKESAISVMRLVVDDSATQLTNATTRAVVAALGVGFVLTVAGTVLIDSLLRRAQGRPKRPWVPAAARRGEKEQTPQQRRRTASARHVGLLGSRKRRRSATAASGSGPEAPASVGEGSVMATPGPGQRRQRQTVSS